LSELAILLVLSAAVLHATWNYLAKRAYGGVPFVWLCSFTATVIYAPLNLFLVLTTNVSLTGTAILFIVVSGVLQLIYFLLLTRAYQLADLSLVYPVARGTGPAISSVAAIILFAERPTPLAAVGTALVVLGIFVLTGDPRKQQATAEAQRGMIFAVLTGITIASYTLWDKQAVSELRLPPLLLNWGVLLLQSLFLLPLIRPRWTAVQREWKDNRLLVIGVAILSPLAYILVLTALSFSPVSYVAPMRESSVLIGALLGARLLAEGDTRRRVLGAAVIAGGVIAIGLG
jgi:drug/metabolite transporter (DMT)-like permease